MKEGSKTDYQAAKAEYENVYAMADANTRLMLDAYMKSAQSYSSANPRNNRDTREFATQTYRNATKMATGNMNTVAPSATNATPGLFGNYTSEENRNDANNLASRFLSFNQGNNRSASSGTNPFGSRGDETFNISGKGYYQFNWAAGLSTGWGFENDTLMKRINRYASALLSNIDEAIGAQNSGMTVKGVNPQLLSKFPELDSSLRLIIANSQNEKGDAMKTLESLIGISRLFDPDATHFMSYFGQFLPKDVPSTQNKRAREAEQYVFDGVTYDFNGDKNLENYAKNYIIGKKGNDYYLFDKDYNLVKTPYTYINDDWRSNTHGWGFAVNENGLINRGDFLKMQPGDPFYELVSKAIKSQADKTFNEQFDVSTSKYSHYTSFSEKDLISNLGSVLNGKRIIDVSKYFHGQPVVATVDDNDIAAHLTPLGQLKLDDPAVKFHYQFGTGENGNPRYVHSASFATACNDLLKGRDINLHNSVDVSKNLHLWDDVGVDLDAFAQPEGYNEDDDFNNRYELTNMFLDGYDVKCPWNQSVSVMYDEDIGKQGSLAALMLLYLFGAGDNGIRKDFANRKHTKEELVTARKNWFGSTKTALLAIYFIFNLLKSLPQMLNSDKRFRLAWIALLNTYKAHIPTADRLEMSEGILANKQGGTINTRVNNIKNLREKYVVKAAWGSSTSLFTGQTPSELSQKESYAAEVRAMLNNSVGQMNELRRRARAEGYSDSELNLYEANKNTKLTASDYIRFGAMAQDVASLISSFIPGYGTVAAAALGVTSMATDLTADIIDPGVSAGDVAKNLGMNAGFALMGLIPGGETTKLTKNIIKWAPKIVAAVGALGVATDESTHRTLEKISKGDESLNHEDWRNLSRILGIISGTARGVRQDVANVKVRRDIKSEDNLSELLDIKGLKGKKISKADLEQLKQHVDDGDAANAKALLKDKVGLSEAQIKKVLKESEIKVGKDKGETKLKLKIETEETYDKAAVRAKAQEILDEEARIKAKQRESWLGRTAEWMGNKLGGGAYSRRERAVINAESEMFGPTEYRNYNPMIDWANRRKSSKVSAKESPAASARKALMPHVEESEVTSQTTPTNATRTSAQVSTETTPTPPTAPIAETTESPTSSSIARRLRGELPHKRSNDVTTKSSTKLAVSLTNKGISSQGQAAALAASDILGQAGSGQVVDKNKFTWALRGLNQELKLVNERIQNNTNKSKTSDKDLKASLETLIYLLSEYEKDGIIFSRLGSRIDYSKLRR